MVQREAVVAWGLSQGEHLLSSAEAARLVRGRHALFRPGRLPKVPSLSHPGRHQNHAVTRLPSCLRGSGKGPDCACAGRQGWEDLKRLVALWP